jgi:hypothetical protein
MSIPGTNDYPNHLYFHAGGFFIGIPMVKLLGILAITVLYSAYVFFVTDYNRMQPFRKKPTLINRYFLNNYCLYNSSSVILTIINTCHP